MKKTIIASTLVLAGLMASPALLHAQSNPSTGITDGTTMMDRDGDFNWSWLGLLGLVGLFGLKRSDREKMNDQGRARALP